MLKRILKAITNFLSDWFQVMVALSIIFILGMYGDYSTVEGDFWDNFLGIISENLIWLPIDVIITIIILERVVDRVNTRKEKKKYARIANIDSLQKSLKEQLTSFVFSDVFPEENQDLEELYSKLINNPEEFITDDFIKSTRTFGMIRNGECHIDDTYNFLGILHIYFGVIYIDLTEHLNKYSMFMQEDIFIKLDSLKNNVSDIGVLSISNPRSYYHTGEKWVRYLITDHSEGVYSKEFSLKEGFKSKLIELINDIDLVIRELENCKR